MSPKDFNMVADGKETGSARSSWLTTFDEPKMLGDVRERLVRKIPGAPAVPDDGRSR